MRMINGRVIHEIHEPDIILRSETSDINSQAQYTENHLSSDSINPHIILQQI